MYREDEQKTCQQKPQTDGLHAGQCLLGHHKDQPAKMERRLSSSKQPLPNLRPTTTATATGASKSAGAEMMDNQDVRRRCGAEGCNLEFTTHSDPEEEVWHCPKCGVLQGTDRLIAQIKQENEIFYKEEQQA